jgi:hypothetical protein
MKNIEEAKAMLQSFEDKEPIVNALITLLDAMSDADNGDINISSNNVGISITDHSIDIVDINKRWYEQSVLTFITTK